MFYYSGTSVCCKEVSKDGLSRDTIIASQISDNFLAAIDLQDNIYVACINDEKGIYLFTYENNQWKLDQVLNIQGSGSVFLLSLFAHNGSTHIIYAKQMAIANFYNIHHLYKPGGPRAYHVNSSWKKNNIGEVYAENIDSAYSALITRDGMIHLVNEWYDGSNYLINYSWYDNGSDGWKKKHITNLFKKDIKVSILYEESILHLLCYTYEDDISAIFYYIKKEGPGREFEFSCLDKIKTESAVMPYFHIESSYIYISWLQDKKFGQYSLNRDQKSWIKKFDNYVLTSDMPHVIEYIRNRKGKALINKKTYFNLDYKNNISLPYFKEGASQSYENNDDKKLQNAEGDSIRYIPYLLDELKSLSEEVKTLRLQIDELEGNKSKNVSKTSTIAAKSLPEHKVNQNNSNGNNNTTGNGNSNSGNSNYGNNTLKKSSFRDQFMNSNRLISRPEATALYVGSTNIPNPEEMSKKEKIEVVENYGARLDEPVTEKMAFTPKTENQHSNQESVHETIQENKQEPEIALEPSTQEMNEQKTESESKQSIEQAPEPELKQELKEEHKEESDLEPKQENIQKPELEPNIEMKQEADIEHEKEVKQESIQKPMQNLENTIQKDTNLFKKIGDFFK
jgi:hypothetical protein